MAGSPHGSALSRRSGFMAPVGARCRASRWPSQAEGFHSLPRRHSWGCASKVLISEPDLQAVGPPNLPGCGRCLACEDPRLGEDQGGARKKSAIDKIAS